jgi:hypothetical protein
MDIASVMDIKIEAVWKICGEVRDRIVERNCQSDGTREKKENGQ